VRLTSRRQFGPSPPESPTSGRIVVESVGGAPSLAGDAASGAFWLMRDGGSEPHPRSAAHPNNDARIHGVNALRPGTFGRIGFMAAAPSNTRAILGPSWRILQARFSGKCHGTYDIHVRLRRTPGCLLQAQQQRTKFALFIEQNGPFSFESGEAVAADTSGFGSKGEQIARREPLASSRHQRKDRHVDLLGTEHPPVSVKGAQRGGAAVYVKLRRRFESGRGHREWLAWGGVSPVRHYS
jgi:hypothetical protein